MGLPFNSQVPHFLERTKMYCAKVLPLVFDNSLSYYESLCKFMHKLNECIDAINAQNLNIIEFTHMVSLEIEKFESYIENRMTEFENQLKTEWLNFKSELETEWAEEKEINRLFRENMETEFENFKTLVNTNFNNLRTELVNDLTTFKNNLEEQQDDFETHILSLQTAFEAREQAARVAYQNNLNNLFDQWKVDTLNAFNQSISGWETDTKADLERYFNLYINQKIATETAILQESINQVNSALMQERGVRETADNDLQEQINQLTPEGGIKADMPDADGNSQLYKINQTTQQRENIYPVINAQGGEDDRVFFNYDLHLNENYFRQTIEHRNGTILTNTSIIPHNANRDAHTYISDCFMIPTDKLPSRPSNPVYTLMFLTIQLIPMTENAANNTNVSILLLNDANDSSYQIRYENRTVEEAGEQVTKEFLIIPAAIVNESINDIGIGVLKIACSFSWYVGGNVHGSGGSIAVDNDLSTTSENPVMNRVITSALNQRPTTSDMNTALSGKADTTTVDSLSQVVANKADASTVSQIQTDLSGKIAYNDIQHTLNPNTNLPISSAVLTSAINAKLDTSAILPQLDPQSGMPVASSVLTSSLNSLRSDVTQNQVDMIHYNSRSNETHDKYAKQLWKYSDNTFTTKENIYPFTGSLFQRFNDFIRFDSESTHYITVSDDPFPYVTHSAALVVKSYIDKNKIYGYRYTNSPYHYIDETAKYLTIIIDRTVVGGSDSPCLDSILVYIDGNYKLYKKPYGYDVTGLGYYTVFEYRLNDNVETKCITSLSVYYEKNRKFENINSL